MFTYIIWYFSAQEISLLSSICLFSYLFISVWTLGFNHYYFIYFIAQMVQLWTLGALVVGPVSLWHTPISVGFCFCFHFRFLALPYFLALEDAPGSYVFSLPVLKSVISPKSPFAGEECRKPGSEHCFCCFLHQLLLFLPTTTHTHTPCQNTILFLLPITLTHLQYLLAVQPWKF